MRVKMNPEFRIQNPVGRGRRTLGRAASVFILATGFWIPDSSPVSAAPSQADVFKSIQQNVGKRSDESSRGLAILLGGAGTLIMVLLVGSKIRRRQAAPKVVDHPRKLMREVMKTVPLKKKELKQLKILAEETHQPDSKTEPVQNPLTLILCPSVLARAVKAHPAKIDRAVVGQLVRKMGAGAR
jgi:hypothetical protein